MNMADARELLKTMCLKLRKRKHDPKSTVDVHQNSQLASRKAAGNLPWSMIDLHKVLVYGSVEGLTDSMVHALRTTRDINSNSHANC